jgi:hypothetical protein
MATLHTSRRAAPPAAGRPQRGPRALLRLTAAGYLTVLVALTVLVSLVYRPQTDSGAPLNGPALLDGWFHRDSGWYWSIAEHGYSYHPGQQSSIAFFPSYPLTVRGVGDVIGGDMQLAGSLVAVIAAFGAVLLFAQWARARLAPRSAVVATALMLLYPFSFFLYGPVYGDSMFILAAVAAFVLLDRGHPVLAAVIGVTATAGRPVGLAVTVGLAVRALELLAARRRAERGEDGPPSLREIVAVIPLARFREYVTLLSVSGLIAWCVYLQVEFGDALAWIHVQEAPGWNQGSGLHTWLKVDFIGTLIKGPLQNVLLLTPQALASGLAVLLIPRVRRLFGWGYAALAAGVLAIAIVGTKDFMGTGRYALAAFPVIAAAGDVLATRSKRWLVPLALGISGTGLVVATFFYSRGFAVS